MLMANSFSSTFTFFPVLQQFYMLSGLNGRRQCSSKESSKVNLLNDDTNGCVRPCVILQTKRTRCTLNKEIQLGKFFGSTQWQSQSLNLTRISQRVFEKVSRLLKCHSIFGGLYTYIYQKNGSHYKASELIHCITLYVSLEVGIFKNKIERRRGRQNNNNNRHTNLPKVITFFTDYKYTT